jgi:TrpR-related protein YerC/YecD
MKQKNPSFPRIRDTQALLQAILALQSKPEAERFLRDLLTEAEITEFANRWKTARLLDEGVSYATIQRVTGLSSTTVARISRWLTAGCNGYRLMLDRANHHHTDTSFQEAVS